MTPIQFAIHVAEKAGKELVKYFRRDEPMARQTNKELKTVYDRIADDLIKKSIEKAFPKHSYLTEETGLVEKDGSEYLWVVDPLDGTGNFMNHNPLFAVSIALWKNGRPLLGVIEAPFLGERFTAELGKGAWHYDQKLKRKQRARVSNVADVNEAYLVTCEGGTADKRVTAGMFTRFYPRVREMRKLGSAALELAWVGLGRADAYITTQIFLWDIGAGVLFVTEAGGKILDFDGKPYRWGTFNPLGRFNVVASNGKVFSKPL